MSQWAEWIGWASALVLLMTISRQVYTQWKTRDTKGVSRWLFIGQTTASTGFLVYSWVLDNWVFVATNALLLVTAAVGQTLFWRNRRREERENARRAAPGGRVGPDAETPRALQTG